MADLDMKSKFITAMNPLFDEIPHKYHFRLHRIYNPSPVHRKWEIEKGRRNTDLHLLFVINGKGCYYFDDREIPLEKGKIIFISNQYPHSAKPVLNDLPHTISIRFGIYDNQTMQHLLDYFTTPFAIDIMPSNTTLFHRLFQRLYLNSKRKSLRNMLPIINSNLTEILMELIAIVSDNSSSIDSRLEAILPLIQPRQDKQYSLKQISQMVNLTEKQLYRLFKKTYNMSPYQYIINCRIRQAIYLLEETTMSVKEIAISLGYSDQYAFSKQFKLITGKAPSSLKS